MKLRGLRFLLWVWFCSNWLILLESITVVFKTCFFYFKKSQVLKSEAEKTWSTFPSVTKANPLTRACKFTAAIFHYLKVETRSWATPKIDNLTKRLGIRQVCRASLDSFVFLSSIREPKEDRRTKPCAAKANLHRKLIGTNPMSEVSNLPAFAPWYLIK